MRSLWVQNSRRKHLRVLSAECSSFFLVLSRFVVEAWGRRVIDMIVVVVAAAAVVKSFRIRADVIPCVLTGVETPYTLSCREQARIV